MENISYCLVLSGGGAKGVYHIGAWKAFKELGLKFEAVVGNSVGALIAGFFAQDDYDGLYSIMSEMGLENFISVPKELVKNGEFYIDKDNFKVLEDLEKDILEKQGLDTLPLKKMLEENLNETKIRNSGMDLGIVTVQLKNLEPLEIFIDDMEDGEVLNYLQASATLPGFKSTEIKDKKFIDGGVYDNIPFGVAKARGYKNIIVLDISGIGVNRRPNIIGTNTIYIKNSIKIGSVLDFDPKFLNDYRELGYLDTLKTFGKLEGWNYFFTRDNELYNSFENILMHNDEFKIYKYPNYFQM